MKKALFCVLALAIALSPFAPAVAQTRGVGVVVKTNDGATREIKLYNASYALVIGNSRYQFWDSLPGVGSDVVAVRAALEKQGFVVETAENLNSESFNRTITKFIDDHGFEPENRLLIYYAGHGFTLGSSGDKRDLGYVVPVDAPDPKTDEVGFKRKAITMDAILNYAKRIESKHALFLFDSCFSGKLVTRNAITIPPIIEEKVSLPVRQFITAGAADQPVPDESYFRRSFVNALAGDADVNGDGYVTGTELAEYLKEQVTNYSNRSQTPQYGKINDVELDRGDFIFVTGSGKNPKVPILTETSGEAALWKTIEDSTNERDFQRYLERTRSGEFRGTYADAAELKLGRLRKANSLARWERFKGMASGLQKYDYIGPFEDGLAVVADAGGKVGFIDETGREVIAPAYESPETHFSEGLASVKSGGKAGYINKSGEVVIPFRFDIGFEFSEGLAGVIIDGKGAYIDKTGKIVIAPGEFGPGEFRDGLAPINRWDPPISEFIDRTGRVAISGSPAFQGANGFSEGLAAVTYDYKKWGYIDRTGRMVISPIYELTAGFEKGLSWVKVVGQGIGMIDRTGKMIIPPKYESGSWFSEGLMYVEIDGKYGYIDVTDKLVISPEYSLARPFSNGMAVVRIGGGPVGGGKFGVIDRSGAKLLATKYDKIWCEVLAKEGLFGVILNGKKGFADIYGNEFFDF